MTLSFPIICWENRGRKQLSFIMVSFSYFLELLTGHHQEIWPSRWAGWLVVSAIWLGKLGVWGSSTQSWGKEQKAFRDRTGKWSTWRPRKWVFCQEGRGNIRTRSCGGIEAGLWGLTHPCGTSFILPDGSFCYPLEAAPPRCWRGAMRLPKPEQLSSRGPALHHLLVRPSEGEGTSWEAPRSIKKPWPTNWRKALNTSTTSSKLCYVRDYE